MTASKRPGRQEMGADRHNHPRRTIGHVKQRITGNNVKLEKVRARIFQGEAGCSGTGLTTDTDIVMRQGCGNRGAVTIGPITPAHITPADAAG